MDKIDSLHDIISDLPEGFKPHSPEPDLSDEGSLPQDISSDAGRPLHCDPMSYKKKLSIHEKGLAGIADFDSNCTGHSPQNVSVGALVDFHETFDMSVENACKINQESFSSFLPSTSPSVHQLTTEPALVSCPVQAVETACSAVTNEAEDIVRKLCRNGKVMEFQEGEDFIKVIVYEDSEEEPDKEKGLSYRNEPKCTKVAAQSNCGQMSQQGFLPQAQSTPALSTQSLTVQKTLYHTPHPRNGYMFYNSDGTPTSASSAAVRPRQPTNTSVQMNYGLGKTPTNMPLNSSGEEIVSPVDQMHTPSSQQLQNHVRSLISLPQCQQVDETGKIREQHNQKERRRRARIKESCNLLRQLVPGMSDKTDKATVFEFTARYVHFLKSHTGAQFDKVARSNPVRGKIFTFLHAAQILDFLMKYSPY